MTTSAVRLTARPAWRGSPSTSARPPSWSLPEAVQGCVDAGLGAIGVWREQVAEVGLDQACRVIADAGLRVSSLCRGGFFTTADADEAKAAEASNRAAIEEAAALNAATLVLVRRRPAGRRSRSGRGARSGPSEALERLVALRRRPAGSSWASSR